MKALTGGLLIDGTGKEPVANATVVIDDDGRIAWAGQTDSRPADTEVIDVSGMTIMPGLIDCHVHLFVDLKPMHELALVPPSLRVVQASLNARATLDAGITTIRDTGGTPLGFKLAAQRGLIPAPVVMGGEGAERQAFERLEEVPQGFLPILGSVPARSRPMFAWCRRKMNTAITPKVSAVQGSPRSSAQTGDKAAAISADRDEMRVMTAVAIHVAQTRRPTGHVSARIVPRKVATPFPPLKP